ncbi:MAG TPA: tail fiber domain-containing protein, partial [Chryseolinea sp.]|nr:tail fiber domain-containing protein [Chryseolinea sp.]
RMAMYSNIDGSYNVANGWNALLHNTNGFSNTAIGAASLNENLTGSSNTATGRDALYDNTTGSYNTAAGFEALKDNIDGKYNTAVGSGSMNQVNRGDQNCAFGYSALSRRRGSYNCAFGASTLGASVENTGNCDGDYNSAFGYDSGPTSAQMCLAMNTTALGAFARVTASNQIRLGDVNVTSIGGQVSWTTLSDGRFKREIRKDVAGLDFINQLNPVSYTLDKKAINAFLRIPDSVQAQNARSGEPARRQVGFVAQEVEALIKKSGYVFTGIEAPQNDDDPYTIRYAEFVVPLVKAVQELSGQVEELREQLKKYEGESTVDQKNAVGAVLYQNSPNPFSTNTSIQMEIPDAYRNANIVVYNLEGKQLKNIQVNERGSVTINISGNELTAGMYLYTLMVDGKVADTKRLVLY